MLFESRKFDSSRNVQSLVMMFTIIIVIIIIIIIIIIPCSP